MPVLGRLVGGVGGRTVVEDEERPVGGGDGEGDEGEEREEVEAGEEGEEEGDIGLFRMPLAMWRSFILSAPAAKVLLGLLAIEFYVSAPTTFTLGFCDKNIRSWGVAGKFEELTSE